MADDTKIEWTDATWNPITGCSVVSPGCANCYAMRLAGTRLKHHPSRAGLTIPSKAGPVWTGEVRFNGQWMDQPFRWTKPRMIFVCAHGDLFHESVPEEWIDKVFAVMALAPQHIFQVLTKRSARMRTYMMRRNENGHHPAMDYAALMAATGYWKTPALDLRTRPLPNVWLGISAEDQKRADERIPDLLATPAAVRWVSAEPMLGLIDFHQIYHKDKTALPWRRPTIDWIVAGGESGPGARPMHPDWIRSIRDQCAAAGVPFHFKQWGNYAQARPRPSGTPGDFAICSPPSPLMNNTNDVPPIKVDCYPRQFDLFGGSRVIENVGKKRAGRRLDGVTHEGFPR